MMEIIPTTKSSVSRQDIETVEPYKKELRLIARKKRVPGHTLFSYNTLSGEIKPAEIKASILLNSDGTLSKKTETVIEKACIYDQALNKKNFVKRLRRSGVYKEM